MRLIDIVTWTKCDEYNFLKNTFIIWNNVISYMNAVSKQYYWLTDPKYMSIIFIAHI